MLTQLVRLLFVLNAVEMMLQIINAGTVLNLFIKYAVLQWRGVRFCFRGKAEIKIAHVFHKSRIELCGRMATGVL